MKDDLLSLPAMISYFTIGAMLYWILGTKPPKTPPGPMGLPVIGYAPFLGKYPWVRLTKLKEKYGQITSFYLGADLTVVLQDYEAIKEAFVDQETIFAGRADPFRSQYLASGTDGLVQGFVQLEDPKWQEWQEFMAQTLGQLGGSRPALEASILKEIDYLCKDFTEQNGQGVDPANKLYQATVNMLADVIMSKRFDYDSHQIKTLNARINIVLQIGDGNLLQSAPWLRFVPSLLRTKWKNVMYGTRSQRWPMLEQELDKHEESYSDSRTRDFLDAYIQQTRRTGDLKNQFTLKNKDDLVAIVELLFSAGPEAVTTTLLWAILFMCRHLDVQQEVQNELDKFIGRGKPVKLSDRELIPYTMATLYEIFRLGGNNPLGVLRSNIAETDIMGYFVPKRSLVIANIWAAHHDPKHFPDPMLFNPERFLNAQRKLHVPPQFILFSIGKRSCPGENLSKSMVFMLFANLFHRFRFRCAFGENLPRTDVWSVGVSARTLPFKVQVDARQ